MTPNGANIRIHGEDTDSPNKSPLIAISGNVIGSQSRAIELKNVNRLSITGNTIYDSADLSLLIQQCSGISIGSNTKLLCSPMEYRPALGWYSSW